MVVFERDLPLGQVVWPWPKPHVPAGIALLGAGLLAAGGIAAGMMQIASPSIDAPREPSQPPQSSLFERVPAANPPVALAVQEWTNPPSNDLFERARMVAAPALSIVAPESPAAEAQGVNPPPIQPSTNLSRPAAEPAAVPVGQPVAAAKPIVAAEPVAAAKPEPAAEPVAIAAPQTAFYMPASVGSDGALEAGLLAGINRERVNAGLAPYASDGRLANIARIRSQQMVDEGYFGHLDPQGRWMYTALLSHFGIGYAWAGENLAMNNYGRGESPERAVAALMASPTHRANILAGDFSAIGVGVVNHPDGRRFYTMIFLG